MKALTASFTLCAALLASSAAQAALVDRGGGLIYDTELNITWLQNANINGAMTWSQANTWASNLSYYDSVRDITYTDWRLPTTAPVNGSAFNNTLSYSGSTDIGTNISAPGTVYAGSTGSEMAYLFYNSLNNDGYCNPETSTASSCVNAQSGWGLTNKGPFTNLQSSHYWSGTEYEVTYYAWAVILSSGEQYYFNKEAYRMYAMAVRPGDVAAVPIPAAAWLLGSGLLALTSVARRKAAQ